ncbi:hypothetical protein BJY16_006704 [Actinoplanes octamycinicus]|uniref:DUF7660 domain-containing protein n=1 Tax=Actinoplanes octamycinicus TaxID=135948 RepID=A0A7W7H3F0_9ACTN|nr:hypothetical protein [Actinoplanes octamycinicus]MBB4743245.1 hypothetical protein [Actinoplanes octamycinicus]GIE61191.1 hypothetical protein Aoc01nite_65930 [Actinoplanes octamycinicus]
MDTGRSTDADPSDVRTREDAVRVIEAMAADLRRHPDAWENATLDRFLEALAAVVEDGTAEPSWRTFAELLVAASGYE